MEKNRVALIFSVILLITSFVYFAFIIFKSKELFLVKFNPSKFEKMYHQSQWIISGSKNLISDETLYAYTGYRYMKGHDPTLLNAEMPPLGKYLIALSILVFNNQNIVILGAAILSLFIIFLVIYLSTHSHIAASGAVFLTTVNSSFTEQLKHMPQLDIFQLLFFLLFLLFFVYFESNKKLFFLIISGVFFGCFISIKFFLPYFLILNLSVLLFYLMKKTKFSKILSDLLILNAIVILTYTVIYAQYFILGGTLRKFLGVQKWIMLFYFQSKIDMTKLIGNYLNLIFFNKWKFWFGTYSTYPYKYWNILWPITFVLGLFSTYKLVKSNIKQSKNLVFILLCFLVVYNAFLFITPIYPRYLLLLFVSLNILIGIYFGKIVTKWLKP